TSTPSWSGCGSCARASQPSASCRWSSATRNGSSATPRTMCGTSGAPAGSAGHDGEPPGSPPPGSVSHECGECGRIMRRMTACVVVEVDVHVLRSLVRSLPAGPGEHPPGPVAELLRGVAAGVQLRGAVQPQVCEVGRARVEARPAAGGVGDGEGDAVCAQRIGQRRVLEALRPGLERVPQRAVLVDLQPRPAVQSLVVIQSQLPDLRGGGGQLPEELVEQAPVELPARGQLPQERPQSGTERESAAG